MWVSNEKGVRGGDGGEEAPPRAKKVISVGSLASVGVSTTGEKGELREGESNGDGYVGREGTIDTASTMACPGSVDVTKTTKSICNVIEIVVIQRKTTTCETWEAEVKRGRDSRGCHEYSKCEGRRAGKTQAVADSVSTRLLPFPRCVERGYGYEMGCLYSDG